MNKVKTNDTRTRSTTKNSLSQSKSVRKLMHAPNEENRSPSKGIAQTPMRKAAVPK